MKCYIDDCSAETVGQSRYCYRHRAESRARFKAMVANQAAERESRDSGFQALYNRAHAAGMAAGEACEPTPMIVDKMYYVPGGACGFAWVIIRPGNCAFANWLKKTGKARLAYGGGVSVWVAEFGQSLARKEAYARAFADCVSQAGITAYAESRLD